MANPQLKRQQAVIWLPPRSGGERAFGSEARLVAQTASPAGIETRRASLDSLEGIRQVSLVFDARDVTLLEVQVPPLSGARLRQALPNIIEDRLLQDVQRCMVVPGPVLGAGRRLVGVVDKEWVDYVTLALARRQIRVDAMWPAQLALPRESGCWSLAAVQDGLVVRTGPHSGLGWAAGEGDLARADAVVSLLDAAGVHEGPPNVLYVYLEDPDDPSWKEPIATAARARGLEIVVLPLPAPRDADMELRDALGGGLAARLKQVDWRPWRWPAGIAALTVVLLLIGLNLNWAMLASERATLRAAMVKTYRDTVPGAGAVIDPVRQLKDHVDTLRGRSGRLGPEDFLALVTQFGQAVGEQGKDIVAAMEYRDGKLKLRFTAAAAEGDAAREKLRQATERLGMKLEFDNERDPTATLIASGA